jgi:hypothetical protein
MVVREAAAMHSPNASLLVYCTVQYIMGMSDYNSSEPATQGGVKNRSHKMLLVQGIQAADCIKYFCLHSDWRDGEMNA